MITLRRGTLGAVGALALVVADAACDSFGEGNPTPAVDASVTDTDAEADGGAIDAEVDGGGAAAVPFCERNANKAFAACDDFEDGVLLNPPWQPALELQNMAESAVRIVEPMSDRFVRFEVPTRNTISAAFLRHDIKTLTSPEVTFGLTLQLTGFTIASDYVEVAVLHIPSGPAAGIALDRGALRLFVANGPSTPLTGTPTARRRIVVTMGLSGAVARDGSGNLLAELAGDAGAGITTFDDLRLGLGLYYTPKCAAGTIDIDDVVIDY